MALLQRAIATSRYAAAGQQQQRREISLEELTSSTKRAITGVPEEQLERKVKIVQPSKHAMSNGRGLTRRFSVEFDHTNSRWNNPLMGWTSFYPSFFLFLSLSSFFFFLAIFFSFFFLF